MAFMKLTDTDGVVFELDIGGFDGLLCSRSSGGGAKTTVYIADGSKIDVKETVDEVMKRYINAWAENYQS